MHLAVHREICPSANGQWRCFVQLVPQELHDNAEAQATLYDKGENIDNKKNLILK